MMKAKKSQSTLEYVIVLTALIICILWAANALFKPALETGLDDTRLAIEAVADKIN